MAIESVEVISGTTCRITKVEELNKDALLAERANKVRDMATLQTRIDTLATEVADLDTILVKLLAKEAPIEATP